MEFTAEMIAGLLGGTIVGDKNAAVHTVSSIEGGKKGALTYLSNPKYEQYIYSTEASIVLVANDFEPKQEVSATLIKLPDVGAAVLKLLEMYNAMKPQKRGISKMCSISDKATVAEDCYVGDFAVIEAGAVVEAGAKIYPQVYVGDGVKIGAGTTLYPGVKIYEGCRVGANCIIHAGAVIGADGFGFLPKPDGTFDKIPQLGNVIIEDNVEIGANTCIDRATMGSTIIKSGVKLDNLIQIAHNCNIGSHTAMAAQVAVAGTTKVGEWCIFGGQAGVSGHSTIGDRTTIGPQCGTIGNTKGGERLLGSPAIDAREYIRLTAYMRKLPAMEKKIKELTKELEALKNNK
jgi:UDP-3-O-[3-hydroxymyristoyl] glucosamine N-acyltransferase